jgi:Zn-dependent membrane protease YugP
VFDGDALMALPYAAQHLGHASQDLRPVRALLIRVSLVPALRSIASATGKPVLFGDFTATMAESDFS